MARNNALEWMEIAVDAMILAVESAGVIGLRAVAASRGGQSATDETKRMIAEKYLALAELQAQFLVGSRVVSPTAAAKRSIRHYRRKVSANRRRLTKG